MKAKKEVERVSHEKIKHLNFFIMDMTNRTMHQHSDIEIILILKGSLVIFTKNETFTMSPGDVAYFNPNEMHASHTGEQEPCTILVIQINLKLLSDHFQPIKNIRFTENNLSACIPAKELPAFRKTCYDLGYNYFCNDFGFQLRCLSDVFRIFGSLLVLAPYETMTSESLQSDLHYQRRLERILNYIEEHYTEKISLTQIAEHEHLSLSYLSHVFKEEMNMSFLEYLNSLRFEHAEEMIRYTDMSILDVCIASGFSDSKYLTKQFKQYYQMTPREFRKQKDLLPAKRKHEQSYMHTEQYQFSYEESVQALQAYHDFDCDNSSAFRDIKARQI